MTVMSRSPKTTMAAVRGMGVAVMTSRSGSCPVPSAPRPLARRAARCSTPKRCCSSMTTTPREWNPTRSVRRAWVPMSRSTVPSARPAWRTVRSAAAVLLVRRATGSGRRPSSVAGSGTESPSSRRRTAEACCSASTSVGAISAPWWPPSTATSRAATATTVLPEPTSPCSSRCMGSGPARSSRMAAMARRWAAVGLKGRPSTNRSSRVGDPSSRATTCRMPRASSLQAALAQHQGQLQAEQLVEGQAAAGRLALGHRGRPVDVVEGRGPVDQPEPGPPAAGQGVGEGPGPVEGLAHVAGEAGRGELGLVGQRVHREDPSGRWPPRRPSLVPRGPEDLGGGAGELEGVPVGADRAVEQGQRARDQLVARQDWLKKTTASRPVSSATSTTTRDGLRRRPRP